MLMIFEDAHWADPTSLELFGRGVNRIVNLRVLLLITFRPEFAPPWIGQPHVTALTLNRLTRREADAMIDRVAGNQPLQANVRQEILERTDGIPLFVEEVTRTVLEARNPGTAERTVAAIPSAAMAVPATLHASLMARLDRLGGPAKDVAQIGAAIGREFSRALLMAVMRKPEADIQSAVDGLVAAGLLFRQGVSTQASYLFKHALVQDAAYSTLLREPRRALHTGIADALERGFANIADNQPEVLARHYTEAGLIEKAAGLWGKAGQRSSARSALVEAIEQLTRALAQIASMTATPALRREQIKLQVALITPVIHAKGYAAPETKAAIERARLLIEQVEALGEPHEDPLLLFSVLYGYWAVSYVAFDGNMMRKLAGEFLALAEAQRETIPLLVGRRVMGVSLLLTGDIAEGQAYLDQAIALYDPAEHRPLATRFGQDVGVAILSYRSWALCFLGYPDAALRDADSALKDAREIGHAPTLMYALNHASWTKIYCRNYTTAAVDAAELAALADEKGAPFWEAQGMVIQGGILAVNGNVSEAAHMLISGITALRSTGATVSVSAHLSHLANARAELGQFDDAWCCASEAIAAVETTRERWYEAEINRIAGEIALMSPKPDETKAFRARTRRRSPTTSKILGTPRRNEHGAALARAGQGAASSRTACSGLRLVHGGFRHARFEGGEGAAGRVGGVTLC